MLSPAHTLQPAYLTPCDWSVSAAPVRVCVWVSGRLSDVRHVTRPKLHPQWGFFHVCTAFCQKSVLIPVNVSMRERKRKERSVVRSLLRHSIVQRIDPFGIVTLRFVSSRFVEAVGVAPFHVRFCHPQHDADPRDVPLVSADWFHMRPYTGIL